MSKTKRYAEILHKMAKREIAKQLALSDAEFLRRAEMDKDYTISKSKYSAHSYNVGEDLKERLLKSLNGLDKQALCQETLTSNIPPENDPIDLTEKSLEDALVEMANEEFLRQAKLDKDYILSDDKKVYKFKYTLEDLVSQMKPDDNDYYNNDEYATKEDSVMCGCEQMDKALMKEILIKCLIGFGIFIVSGILGLLILGAII